LKVYESKLAAKQFKNDKNMRIMGIDFGTKRIGLAVSDESNTFASELEIIAPKDFWATLSDKIAQFEIESFVVGLPLNMSGEFSEKTKEAQAFGDKLQTTTNLHVEMMDERLSSSMASTIFASNGASGGNKGLDSLAAQIILQNYLDKIKNNV
jgi:putative holliday junction resolvase